MSNPAEPIFSAIDLLRMLFGVLITASGAVASLLFFARLKRKDYALLYFGLGALLYGVRLFVSGSAGYVHHRWDLLDPVVSLVIIIALFLVDCRLVCRGGRVWNHKSASSPSQAGRRHQDLVGVDRHSGFSGHAIYSFPFLWP